MEVLVEKRYGSNGKTFVAVPGVGSVEVTTPQNLPVGSSIEVGTPFPERRYPSHMVVFVPGLGRVRTPRVDLPLGPLTRP